MKRMFSAVQPTGNIHLGNYFGAIKGWVQNQADFHNTISVVDLHAITVNQSKTLKEDTLSTAALYLACGITPDVSTVFIQSHVSAHAELAWILNCVTPITWVQKMTQFKEKSEDESISASVGLFDYPVLMAADILLYQTDVVPVGNDQKQHLELCRKIANTFNRKFGKTFVVPEPLYQVDGGRVMSLQDASKKMSKSDPSESSRINLLDNADKIAKKIRTCKTDTVRGLQFDAARPEATNLLTLYSLLSGKSKDEAALECQDMSWSQFKELLTTSTIDYLNPIQRKHQDLIENPFYLERCLKLGAEKAQEDAAKTMVIVKEKLKMF